ncbi:MAG: hypothetical protein AMXMBFR56_62070 [Polyangiaceae bacterium]
MAKTHRLRSVAHPGDREKRVPVTVVRRGEQILGANVWNHVCDDAVFVRGEDLESVGRELLRLAEERRCPKVT